MNSLIDILLKKSYWRMLLRKATWSEAGMSVRRAHKDRRARKHLLGLALMVLAPLMLIVYLAWLVGTGAIWIAPFVIPVIWWIRRMNRKEDEAVLRIAPAAEPVTRELGVSEREAARAYFARLAVVHAAFVHRAGSEAFLKQNELPPGHEVVSRRLHLELLRTTGVWESLSAPDREAMIAADGNWEWETINRVVLSIEPLRLLRWILRLDFYLPLVGQHLQVDYKLASDIVHAPQKVLEGTGLAGVPMLEVGRDGARNFVLRCMAELISRGCQEPANEDVRKWAAQTSEQLGGNQHEDFLLEGRLVSEATEQQIRWAAALSQKRAAFLQWTIDVMEEKAKLEPEFAQIT